MVGIDASDVRLVNEALELLDYLSEHGLSMVMEQLAFSIVLAGRTRIRASRDVIFHYNVNPTRSAFRARIPELIAESEGMSLSARAEWLYAHRMRLAAPTSARNLAKDLLNTLGILRRRDRCGCL